MGNIVHIDIDFNLTNVPPSDFVDRLDRMLESFETGKFQE
jgi:hypothetical protein